jgi:PhnB protein
MTMSDELDPLRRMRPDHLQPDDTVDPTVFTRHKEQLMSTISGTANPAHDGLVMPSVYPRLAYDDQLAAIDYLERVLQFYEIREARNTFDDHVLAWLRCGDGVVMISAANTEVHQIASPRTRGGTTVMIVVHVEDVDAHFEHAVLHQAQVTTPLGDTFYGERRYEVTDPEGHRWHIGERHEHIRARGGSVPD